MIEQGRKKNERNGMAVQESVFEIRTIETFKCFFFAFIEITDLRVYSEGWVEIERERTRARVENL